MKQNLFLALVILAGCDNRPPSQKDATSPVVHYHESNPQMAALFAEFEGKGLFLFEPQARRVYVAPTTWQSWDAKRREFLVQAMALECARRRGDQSLTLDVLDKLSGKPLATHSGISGVEIK